MIHPQLPSAILMVRPRHFGFNPLTASSNAFQEVDAELSTEEIRKNALKEFDNYVAVLKSHDVQVIVIEDTDEPLTPDAVFPNNWISFHKDGTTVLYPMMAPNRRLERRDDILLSLQNEHQYNIKKIIDLTSEEINGKYLEGTGSVVFDYDNKIAYANPSPRTDINLFKKLCAEIGFEPFVFPATDENGQDVYHTNVLMCIGDEFVVICLEAIPDEGERLKLIRSFESTGHEIVDISFNQMHRFAGNMLQLLNKEKEPLLVMSQTAYESLSNEQVNTLSAYADLVYAPLDTIEKIGGGSARCMLAGIFLPKI